MVQSSVGMNVGTTCVRSSPNWSSIVIFRRPAVTLPGNPKIYIMAKSFASTIRLLENLYRRPKQYLKVQRTHTFPLHICSLYSIKLPMSSTIADRDYAVTIPDTLRFWPWPRKINPHYSICKKESSEWCESFKAFSTGAQNAFNKCDFSKRIFAFKTAHINFIS